MEKTLEILEFTKVKEQILQYNINALSRKKVNDLQPLFFHERIEEELEKTKEGYAFITNGMIPSLNQLPDISSSLQKISKGGILSLEEIYDFVHHLEVVHNLIAFSHEKEVTQIHAPFFFQFISHLHDLLDLKENIQYCISENYTLYDHASSKLKSIRKQMKNIEEEIKEKLNGYLKSHAEMLSDQYIATRGTHLVLPVKIAYKNQIKGIIVDVSSSNNTVFIEPYMVSENHARLEQLHYEEEMEMQRIIKALCEMINRQNQPLMVNNEMLTEISFMLLKGQYGLQNNYEIATLSEQQEIQIIDGRHPLIHPNKVIGNDFHLGNKNQRMIVISGPNAGGKTVALKTIGILVLMNQCGLPLPVKEAHIGVFSKIFVDIGDEQSIEHSLSGFSSHMAKVSKIVDEMDQKSLILLDELGSRTDPKEGEALAKAIIESIEEIQAIAMITTHYIGIKDFAKESSQITLASMSFDEKTLMPTYHLLLNIVGRSYAFEISSRLGLKEKIIARAKQFKDDQSNQLDQLIDEMNQTLKKENEQLQQIESLKVELQQEKDAIAIERQKLMKNYEKQMDEVNEKKAKMLEEAYEEIQTIVDQFKLQSKEGYKHHLKNEALAKLDQLQNMDEGSEAQKDVFQKGDMVLLKSLQRVAKIQEIKGNQATILLDHATMRIKLSELEKVHAVEEKKKLKKNVSVNNTIDLSKSIPLQLNLVGQHVEEGIILLRQYLDHAFLAHHHQVSIIHGVGTGALRKAVHEYLKKCKFVEEFHFASYNEGGVGATIVTLRK